MSSSAAFWAAVYAIHTCSFVSTNIVTIMSFSWQQDHMQGVKFVLGQAMLRSISCPLQSLAIPQISVGAPVGWQPVQLRPSGQGDGASLRTGGFGGAKSPGSVQAAHVSWAEMCGS